MNQSPHVAFRFNGRSWQALYGELYFSAHLPKAAAAAPGGYAGPFTALSASNAVFIDSCSPCDDYGTAPFDIITDAGRRISYHREIPGINTAEAISFATPDLGWVIGLYERAGPPPSYAGPTSARILSTADGGRHWHIQYSIQSGRG
jgi:hypothetical protein